MPCGTSKPFKKFKRRVGKKNQPNNTTIPYTMKKVVQEFKNFLGVLLLKEVFVDLCCTVVVFSL